MALNPMRTNDRPIAQPNVRQENILNFAPPQGAELRKLGMLFIGSVMMGLGAATMRILGSIGDDRVPLPFYILVGVYFCYRVLPVVEEIKNVFNGVLRDQDRTAIAKSCAAIAFGLAAGYALGMRRVGLTF